MFEEVVPHNLRMLAGNHRNNTNSACEVKNVDESQPVAFIFRENKRVNGCRVTKLSVCAKSRWQVGSRMPLTLAHIASQLNCCANCSCAATSNTNGSCKCMVRGMSQVRVHLTKTCNQSSLLLGCKIGFRLISGSDHELSWPGIVSRGVRLKASLTVDVIRLSATEWGFTRCDDNNKSTSASCIQMKLRSLLDSSPHVLRLLDDIHFSRHAI